jgi:hypothetical protein
LAQHIAEVDQTITELQALEQAFVERRESLDLAMNRCDGPYSPGPPQYRIDWRLAGS